MAKRYFGFIQPGRINKKSCFAKETAFFMPGTRIELARPLTAEGF